MKKLAIGIIREEKTPPDKRVPFTPIQCSELLKEYPNIEIYIQPSSIRCYSDNEYTSFGLPVAENLSNCDILMGVKEIPKEKLLANKTYIFFSHTIKKQPHNLTMLQEIVKKKITLIDYETLTDENGNRIIGFGRYAGIVGAYNGLLGYGKKYDLFHVKPAHLCRDKAEMEEELKRIKLPNIKILITGGGRVANGALETVSALKIRKVTPYEFLHCSFREPVYCQLHSKDYHEAKDGSSWNKNEFYEHPEKYNSTFLPYTKVCDLLITGHFWAPGCPVLFSKADMKSADFRISVIADISCDIDGSVPSTLRASSIDNPFYGYNPITEKEDIAFGKETITVMAVDNLPCELPRDASEDFGKELQERVAPFLFTDNSGPVERATIVYKGELTLRFSYLAKWLTT